MKKILLLLTLFNFFIVKAQTNITASYIPAKCEFETSIGYKFDDNVEMGILYSENKHVLFRNLNPETIYYYYLNAKFNDNIYWHFAFGDGCESDIETSINYKFIKNFHCFESCIGISKTELLILEFRYSLIF